MTVLPVESHSLDLLPEPVGVPEDWRIYWASIRVWAKTIPGQTVEMQTLAQAVAPPRLQSPLLVRL